MSLYVLSYCKQESAGLLVELGVKAALNGFCFLWLVLSRSQLHDHIGIGQVAGPVKVWEALAGEDDHLELTIFLLTLEGYGCHIVATCLVGGLALSEGRKVLPRTHRPLLNS